MNATATSQKPGTVVTLSFHIPDEELDNILSGCFEGGSNYWISRVEVVDDNYMGAEFASQVISKGGYLNIIESGEFPKRSVKHELSKPMLLNGFVMYAHAMRELDFNSMDARDYDMILQYAIFQKLKYS